MNILSCMPKWAVKLFSKPYIAGETKEEALEVVRKLNDQGFSATLDILGEHAEYEKSIETTDQYCEVLENIQELDCGISIKATHLGMAAICGRFDINLERILDASKGKPVCLDMEDSPFTTFIISNYKTHKRDNLRLALQAYLIRTLNDIKHLPKNSTIRVCKGIYNEPPNIAFKDPHIIRINFNEIVTRLLNDGHKVAIATHDFRILTYSSNFYNDYKDRIEFQFLYGVPVGDWLARIRDYGYNVRVYVPFGNEWYPYCIRRMKENPKLIRYVLKNFFMPRNMLKW